MKILKGRYILYFAGCAVFAIQNFMGNILTGQLYRTVIRLGEGAGYEQAVKILLVMLAMLAGVSITIWIGQKMYMKASVGAERKLRQTLVHQICYMPFLLWTQRPASDWINLFSRDIDVVMDAYKQKLVSMVTQIGACLGGIILVFSQNIAMGLFCTGCGALYFISVFALKEPKKRVQQQFWKSLEKGSQVLAEMIKGVHIIRFYQLENYFNRKYSKIMEENMAAGRINLRINTLAQSSKNFGYSISYMGSLIFGLMLVSQGQLDVADLMYLWSLGIGIAYGIQSIGLQLLELQENLTAKQRVQESCKLPIEVEGTRKIQERHPVIELEKVHFSYVPERPILNGVTCQIHPGEKLAIVGLSGSGKTTMIKLMLGLFRPTAGKVRVGGLDTSEARRESLCAQFAYLPQMPFLLNDTIEENLRLVMPEAGEKELLQVCKQAGLQNLIEKLPKGLHTKIGENGRELSGGERQRLGVARCFLKNSPIMVLDEMTSALDAGLEEELVRRLFAMQEKTVICITHRLKAAELSDRILLMEEGHIVEEGSHEELVKKGGKYAELYRKSDINQL